MKKKNPHHVTISNPSSYFSRLLKENYQIDRYFFPYRKRNYKNSHFHQQPLRLLKISTKTDYTHRIHARVKPISFLNVSPPFHAAYISCSPSIFAPPPPFFSSHTTSSRHDSRASYLNYNGNDIYIPVFGDRTTRTKRKY